jgi:2'-5' RNA ligase
MPFEVRQVEGGWVVFNARTGHRFSKTPLTQSAAQNQLKALHAAENEQIDRDEWLSGKSHGSTGVMIAVYLDPVLAGHLQSITRGFLGTRVGVDAELMPNDYLHMTLAYIGKVEELERDHPGLKEKLLRGLDKATEAYRREVGDDGWCGFINGFARFFPEDETLETPLVYVIDSSCIARWRPKIVNAVEAELANIDESHGFLPHITTAYLAPGSSVPDIQMTPIEFKFCKVCLEWGDERYEFSLDAESEPIFPATPYTSFLVMKEFADQPYRWLAVSSTSFQDRDAEWLTAQALKDDELRGDLLAEAYGGDLAARHKAYGPLRWAHLGFPYLEAEGDWTSATAGPGIDLGWCDFSTVELFAAGASLIESGTFDEDDIALIMRSKARQLGLSLTFGHPVDQPGVTKTYHDIRKVERSLMPWTMPSNLGTFMAISNKETQSMDQHKLDMLEGLGVPKERITAFVDRAEARADELRKMGILSKEAGGAGDPNLAVKNALDLMQQGMAALGTALVADKAGPPAFLKEDDEAKPDEAKEKAKKEDGDGDLEMDGKKKEADAVASKAVQNAVAALEVNVGIAMKAINDRMAALQTGIATKEAVDTLKTNVDALTITTKELQQMLQTIGHHVQSLVGDMPPGLFGQHNQVQPGSPLFQFKEQNAGANNNNGGGGQPPANSPADVVNPFAWLDQKLFGGVDPQTQQQVQQLQNVKPSNQ